MRDVLGQSGSPASPGAWTGRGATQSPDPALPSRRAARQKKTVKLSRALSDLVKYTKSVGIHDVETEGEGRRVWGGRGALG